jgi:hypothetical protein
LGFSLLTGILLFSLSATSLVVAQPLISRQHLVEMSSTGYDKLKDKIMSLDNAVETTIDDDGVTCEVKEPRKSKTSQMSTAPMHFYANVIGDDRVTNDTRGENDIFWNGDNFNRNGRTDSYLKTMDPHPAFGSCLHFTLQEKSKNLKFKFDQKAQAAYAFGVNFRRGTPDKYGLVDFNALMEIRTYVDHSEAVPSCKSYAAVCLNTGELNGKQVCQDGMWQQLRTIVAELNYKIAFREYFSFTTIPETEKHDVDALSGLVSDLDQNGIPDKTGYVVKLAGKRIF